MNLPTIATPRWKFLILRYALQCLSEFLEIAECQ